MRRDFWQHWWLFFVLLSASHCRSDSTVQDVETPDGGAKTDGSIPMGIFNAAAIDEIDAVLRKLVDTDPLVKRCTLIDNDDCFLRMPLILTSMARPFLQEFTETVRTQLGSDSPLGRRVVLPEPSVTIDYSDIADASFPYLRFRDVRESSGKHPYILELYEPAVGGKHKLAANMWFDKHPTETEGVLFYLEGQYSHSMLGPVFYRWTYDSTSRYCLFAIRSHNPNFPGTIYLRLKVISETLFSAEGGFVSDNGTRLGRGGLYLPVNYLPADRFIFLFLARNDGFVQKLAHVASSAKPETETLFSRFSVAATGRLANPQGGQPSSVAGWDFVDSAKARTDMAELAGIVEAEKLALDIDYFKMLVDEEPLLMPTSFFQTAKKPAALPAKFD
jgi:hypothetical protein